jgi:hypothetical protein
MGIIRDTKVNMVISDARRAYAEGRRVFAARLNSPNRLDPTSGSVGDWAEMIEAVEAEGWVLSDWAVGDGSKGLSAYPLFRRRRNG